MAASDPSKYEEILIESNDQSNSVDIRLGVQSFDYYEDIFSPTITAKVIVTETGNSVNGKGTYQGLPLRGGERVSVKIAANSPNNKDLDFSEKSKYLYVSSISNVLNTNQSETFTLNLCSREAITNETARIPIKFPTSSPISASAEKIITTYLQTGKNVEVDQTMNKYGFIGNLRKPFTVLTWLASKGVPESEGKSTAGYVFYETQSGYKFKSLDKLIWKLIFYLILYNKSTTQLSLLTHFSLHYCYVKITIFHPVVSKIKLRFYLKPGNREPMFECWDESGSEHPDMVPHRGVWSKENTHRILWRQYFSMLLCTGS